MKNASGLICCTVFSSLGQREKHKRLADEKQICAEIDVDSCRGGKCLRQKDTNCARQLNVS